MDGFTLPDVVGVIAASAAILAVLIAYLVMVSQYLSSRYTPLIIPAFLRRLVTRRRVVVLVLACLFLVLSLVPPSIRLGSIAIDTLFAFLTTFLLLFSLGWLCVGMYQLYAETMDSVGVVKWLKAEGAEVRQTALREIIVPALARMDLAAVNAALSAAMSNGIDDEKAMLPILMAQRRTISSEWIAQSILDELLSGLDAAALARRRRVIQAILAESLHTGLTDVATSTIDRLFSVMKEARPWQRIHSEVVVALGDTVWEARPSDDLLPHHRWIDRPHMEAEGKFGYYLRYMQQDVCRTTDEHRDWGLTLHNCCQILHWLLANALVPPYLEELLGLCEQIVWFAPRDRLLDGPVVQELCYGLSAARTCVHAGKQRGGQSDWTDAVRRIDEVAVDLAACVAEANKPGLLATALQSSAFTPGIGSICLKPEIISMGSYDIIADRFRIMRFSDYLRRKQRGETLPSALPNIRTLVGLKQPPMIVAAPKPWPSN